jgi:hypothetical protein
MFYPIWMRISFFAQAWAMRTYFGRSSGQSRYNSKFGAVALSDQIQSMGFGPTGPLNMASVGNQHTGDSGCRSVTGPGIASKSGDREELNYERRATACW